MDSAIKKVLEESKTIKASGAILALCAGENDGRSKTFSDWVRYVKGDGIKEGVNLPPHDFTYLVPDAGEVGILEWEDVGGFIERESRFTFGHCGENLFVTSGSLSNLQPGDLLYIGLALLVVTHVGKKCDRDCGFSNGEEEPCDISKSWAFANVLKGGQVCVDDPFIAM